MCARSPKGWPRALLAAGAVLFGARAAALDLLESWASAQAFDPAIHAAGSALAAGREQAVQGDALLRPQLSLSSDYARLDERSATSVPPRLAALTEPSSAGYVYQAALELKQPLYDPHANAERRQLHERRAQAELAWRDAEQQLMRRVSETYFGLLLAQESLRVVEAEKSAVGLQRERAQARFDFGRGRITEVQEAQARLDGVLSREVSARATLELREAEFRELTGETGELAPLDPAFRPARPQPDDLSAWQSRAMDNNSGVLLRRSELGIADAELAKHRLRDRPTLEFVASYVRKGQDGGLSALSIPEEYRSSSIGVQLSVPLAAGGALGSRAREALARQQEARDELRAAQRDARLLTQDAFLAVGTGVARIAALQQSVQSARTALEATTLDRDVGNRTELDVLDAQQRLYAAELDLARARNDYLLGRVRLSAAVGELGLQDLRDLNDCLIQETHQGPSAS